MRVAVAQPLTRPGELLANVAAHVGAVRHAGARLVVFPELSLTGYAIDAPVVDPRSPALRPLVEVCAEIGTTALAGAPLRVGEGEDAARGIGVLAIDAAGVRPVYVKMNLGPTESRRFEAGRRPCRLDLQGWRVGVGVCRDTRMSEHLAATAALGIDLYVAGLAHAPAEEPAIEARAARIRQRFEIPVAFAVYAGTDGGADASCGGSALWDMSGRCLATCTAEPGEVAIAVLT